ncbi:amidase family protein, partial [Glutamicibacter sp.]
MVNNPVKELIKLSATELAAKLRAGETTSVEAVQAHLDRITEVDGTLNAFLHVNAEEALAVAAEVDAIRAAGGAQAEALHPLAGVPIAIKDLIVTKGQPT